MVPVIKEKLTGTIQEIILSRCNSEQVSSWSALKDKGFFENLSINIRMERKFCVSVCQGVQK